MNRFSQKDILRGSMTNGMSLNRYAYCGNDPINHIDPSGETWKSALSNLGNKITSGIKNIVKNPVQTAVNALTTVAKAVTNPVSTAVKTAKAVTEKVKDFVADVKAPAPTNKQQPSSTGTKNTNGSGSASPATLVKQQNKDKNPTPSKPSVSNPATQPKACDSFWTNAKTIGLNVLKEIKDFGLGFASSVGEEIVDLGGLAAEMVVGVVTSPVGLFNPDQYYKNLHSIQRKVDTIKDNLEKKLGSYAEDKVAFNAGQVVGDVAATIAEIAGLAKAAEGAAAAIKSFAELLSSGSPLFAEGPAFALAGEGIEVGTGAKALLAIADGLLNLSDIAKDVDSLKESIEDKKSGETSEPQSQPDSDSVDIELSDKKMYQQGDHFNEHGREMGYGSKKEYEAAAREFFETNKDTADIYEGMFNNRGGQNNRKHQYIIQADGKTLIVDKATGQLIDFYNTIGSGMDSFIDIVKIQ